MGGGGGVFQVNQEEKKYLSGWRHILDGCPRHGPPHTGVNTMSKVWRPTSISVFSDFPYCLNLVILELVLSTDL